MVKIRFALLVISSFLIISCSAEAGVTDSKTSFELCDKQIIHVEDGELSDELFSSSQAKVNKIDGNTPSKSFSHIDDSNHIVSPIASKYLTSFLSLYVLINDDG